MENKYDLLFLIIQYNCGFFQNIFYKTFHLLTNKKFQGLRAILVNRFNLVVELSSMKTFILPSIILCFCNTLLYVLEEKNPTNAL